MSKFVDMTNWSPVTAAVYAELLANPDNFDAVYDAARPGANTKKNSYWHAAKKAQEKTTEIITKSLPPNTFASRVIGAALSKVNWDSLTRRIINQGKSDSQVYRDITGLIERTSGNGKEPTQAK